MYDECSACPLWGTCKNQLPKYSSIVMPLAIRENIAMCIILKTPMVLQLFSFSQFG